jgi:hypothetical protein
MTRRWSFVVGRLLLVAGAWLHTASQIGRFQYAKPSGRNKGPRGFPSAAPFSRNISSPQVVVQFTK